MARIGRRYSSRKNTATKRAVASAVATLGFLQNAEAFVAGGVAGAAGCNAFMSGGGAITAVGGGSGATGVGTARRLSLSMVASVKVISHKVGRKGYPHIVCVGGGGSCDSVTYA